MPDSHATNLGLLSAVSLAGDNVGASAAGGKAGGLGARNGARKAHHLGQGVEEWGGEVERRGRSGSKRASRVVGGVCVVPGGETGLSRSCGRGSNCAFHLGFLTATVILVPWLADPSPRKRSGLIPACEPTTNGLRRVSQPGREFTTNTGTTAPCISCHCSCSPMQSSLAGHMVDRLQERPEVTTRPLPRTPPPRPSNACLVTETAASAPTEE